MEHLEHPQLNHANEKAGEIAQRLEIDRNRLPAGRGRLRGSILIIIYNYFSPNQSGPLSTPLDRSINL
jgi:hypothetical protein